VPLTTARSATATLTTASATVSTPPYPFHTSFGESSEIKHLPLHSRSGMIITLQCNCHAPSENRVDTMKGCEFCSNSSSVNTPLSPLHTSCPHLPSALRNNIIHYFPSHSMNQWPIGAIRALRKPDKKKKKREKRLEVEEEVEMDDSTQFTSAISGQEKPSSPPKPPDMWASLLSTITYGGSATDIEAMKVDRALGYLDSEKLELELIIYTILWALGQRWAAQTLSSVLASFFVGSTNSTYHGTNENFSMSDVEAVLIKAFNIMSAVPDSSRKKKLKVPIKPSIPRPTVQRAKDQVLPNGKRTIQLAGGRKVNVVQKQAPKKSLRRFSTFVSLPSPPPRKESDLPFDPDHIMHAFAVAILQMIVPQTMSLLDPQLSVPLRQSGIKRQELRKTAFKKGLPDPYPIFDEIQTAVACELPHENLIRQVGVLFGYSDVSSFYENIMNGVNAAIVHERDQVWKKKKESLKAVSEKFVSGQKGEEIPYPTPPAVKSIPPLTLEIPSISGNALTSGAKSASSPLTNNPILPSSVRNDFNSKELGLDLSVSIEAAAGKYPLISQEAQKSAIALFNGYKLSPPIHSLEPTLPFTHTLNPTFFSHILMMLTVFDTVCCATLEPSAELIRNCSAVLRGVDLYDEDRLEDVGDEECITSKTGRILARTEREWKQIVRTREAPLYENDDSQQKIDTSDVNKDIGEMILQRIKKERTIHLERCHRILVAVCHNGDFFLSTENDLETVLGVSRDDTHSVYHTVNLIILCAGTNDVQSSFEAIQRGVLFIHMNSTPSFIIQPHKTVILMAAIPRVPALISAARPSNSLCFPKLASIQSFRKCPFVSMMHSGVEFVTSSPDSNDTLPPAIAAAYHRKELGRGWTLKGYTSGIHTGFAGLLSSRLFVYIPRKIRPNKVHTMNVPSWVIPDYVQNRFLSHVISSAVSFVIARRVVGVSGCRLVMSCLCAVRGACAIFYQRAIRCLAARLLREENKAKISQMDVVENVAPGIVLQACVAIYGVLAGLLDSASLGNLSHCILVSMQNAECPCEAGGGVSIRNRRKKKSQRTMGIRHSSSRLAAKDSSSNTSSEFFVKSVFSPKSPAAQMSSVPLLSDVVVDVESCLFSPAPPSFLPKELLPVAVALEGIHHVDVQRQIPRGIITVDIPAITKRFLVPLLTLSNLMPSKLESVGEMTNLVQHVTIPPCLQEHMIMKLINSRVGRSLKAIARSVHCTLIVDALCVEKHVALILEAKLNETLGPVSRIILFRSAGNDLTSAGILNEDILKGSQTSSSSLNVHRAQEGGQVAGLFRSPFEQHSSSLNVCVPNITYQSVVEVGRLYVLSILSALPLQSLTQIRGNQKRNRFSYGRRRKQKEEGDPVAKTDLIMNALEKIMKKHVSLSPLRVSLMILGACQNFYSTVAEIMQQKGIGATGLQSSGLNGVVIGEGHGSKGIPGQVMPPPVPGFGRHDSDQAIGGSSLDASEREFLLDGSDDLVDASIDEMSEATELSMGEKFVDDDEYEEIVEEEESSETTEESSVKEQPVVQSPKEIAPSPSVTDEGASSENTSGTESTSSSGSGSYESESSGSSETDSESSEYASSTESSGSEESTSGSASRSTSHSSTRKSVPAESKESADNYRRPEESLDQSPSISGGGRSLDESLPADDYDEQYDYSGTEDSQKSGHSGDDDEELSGSARDSMDSSYGSSPQKHAVSFFIEKRENPMEVLKKSVAMAWVRAVVHVCSVCIPPDVATCPLLIPVEDIRSHAATIFGLKIKEDEVSMDTSPISSLPSPSHLYSCDTVNGTIRLLSAHLLHHSPFQPILLTGQNGVGKKTLLKAAAKLSKMGFVGLDLLSSEVSLENALTSTMKALALEVEQKQNVVFAINIPSSIISSSAASSSLPQSILHTIGALLGLDSMHFAFPVGFSMEMSELFSKNSKRNNPFDISSTLRRAIIPVFIISSPAPRSMTQNGGVLNHHLLSRFAVGDVIRIPGWGAADLAHAVSNQLFNTLPSAIRGIVNVREGNHMPQSVKTAILCLTDRGVIDAIALGLVQVAFSTYQEKNDGGCLSEHRRTNLEACAQRPLTDSTGIHDKIMMCGLSPLGSFGVGICGGVAFLNESEGLDKFDSFIQDIVPVGPVDVTKESSLSITPIEMLTFMQMFKTIFLQIIGEYFSQLSKSCSALHALSCARSDIEGVSKELQMNLKRLEANHKEVSDKLEFLVDESSQYEALQNKLFKVIHEEQLAADRAAESARLAATAAAAKQPAIDVARASLRCVSIKDLSRLRKMRHAPSLVRRTFDCVAIILGFGPMLPVKPCELGDEYGPRDSFEVTRHMVEDGSFVHYLLAFDPVLVSSEIVELLCPYLEAPDFNPIAAKRVSESVAGLVGWVCAVVQHHKVYMDAKPVNERNKKAAMKLKEARNALNNTTAELHRVQEKLQNAGKEFATCAAEKDKLEGEIQVNKQTQQSSRVLMKMLSKEAQGWYDKVVNVTSDLFLLPSSACVETFMLRWPFRIHQPQDTLRNVVQVFEQGNILSELNNVLKSTRIDVLGSVADLAIPDEKFDDIEDDHTREGFLSSKQSSRRDIRRSSSIGTLAARASYSSMKTLSKQSTKDNLISSSEESDDSYLSKSILWKMKENDQLCLSLISRVYNALPNLTFDSVYKVLYDNIPAVVWPQNDTRPLVLREKGVPASPDAILSAVNLLRSPLPTFLYDPSLLISPNLSTFFSVSPHYIYSHGDLMFLYNIPAQPTIQDLSLCPQLIVATVTLEDMQEKTEYGCMLIRFCEILRDLVCSFPLSSTKTPPISVSGLGAGGFGIPLLDLQESDGPEPSSIPRLILLCSSHHTISPHLLLRGRVRSSIQIINMEHCERGERCRLGEMMCEIGDDLEMDRIRKARVELLEQSSLLVETQTETVDVLAGIFEKEKVTPRIVNSDEARKKLELLTSQFENTQQRVDRSISTLIQYDMNSISIHRLSLYLSTILSLFSRLSTLIDLKENTAHLINTRSQSTRLPPNATLPTYTHIVFVVKRLLQRQPKGTGILGRLFFPVVRGVIQILFHSIPFHFRWASILLLTFILSDHPPKLLDYDVIFNTFIRPKSQAQQHPIRIQKRFATSQKSSSGNGEETTESSQRGATPLSRNILSPTVIDTIESVGLGDFAIACRDDHIHMEEWASNNTPEKADISARSALSSLSPWQRFVVISIVRPDRIYHAYRVLVHTTTRGLVKLDQLFSLPRSVYLSGVLDILDCHNSVLVIKESAVNENMFVYAPLMFDSMVEKASKKRKKNNVISISAGSSPLVCRSMSIKALEEGSILIINLWDGIIAEELDERQQTKKTCVTAAANGHVGATDTLYALNREGEWWKVFSSEHIEPSFRLVLVCENMDVINSFCEVLERIPFSFSIDNDISARDMMLDNMNSIDDTFYDLVRHLALSRNVSIRSTEFFDEDVINEMWHKRPGSEWRKEVAYFMRKQQEKEDYERNLGNYLPTEFQEEPEEEVTVQRSRYQKNEFDMTESEFGNNLISMIFGHMIARTSSAIGFSITTGVGQNLFGSNLITAPQTSNAFNILFAKSIILFSRISGQSLTSSFNSVLSGINGYLPAQYRCRLTPLVVKEAQDILDEKRMHLNIHHTVVKPPVSLHLDSVDRDFLFSFSQSLPDLCDVLDCNIGHFIDIGVTSVLHHRAFLFSHFSRQFEYGLPLYIPTERVIDSVGSLIDVRKTPTSLHVFNTLKLVASIMGISLPSQLEDEAKAAIVAESSASSSTTAGRRRGAKKTVQKSSSSSLTLHTPIDSGITLYLISALNRLAPMEYTQVMGQESESIVPFFYSPTLGALIQGLSRAMVHSTPIDSSSNNISLHPLIPLLKSIPQLSVALNKNLKNWIEEELRQERENQQQRAEQTDTRGNRAKGKKQEKTLSSVMALLKIGILKKLPEVEPAPEPKLLKRSVRDMINATAEPATPLQPEIEGIEFSVAPLNRRRLVLELMSLIEKEIV
ncbi:hypothetical protein ADUPG1_007754, partial [Aduncisulcus paluster]